MPKNEIYWKTIYSDEIKFDQKLPDEIFDVVIVGAGIIGLTTAFYLVNKGLKIAIVDKKTIGGNSSLSAGIISYDNEQDLSVWVEDLGYDSAKKLIDIMRNSAMELIGLIEKNGFDSPEKNGVIVVARDESENQILAEDIKLHKKFGVDLETLNIQNLNTLIGMKDMVKGYFNPSLAAINPYKTFRNMAKYLKANGCFLNEFCNVEEIDYTNLSLKTEKGLLRAKKILISASVNKKITKIKKPSLKLSASLFVTEPLSKMDQNSIGWSRRQIVWSIGKSFSYYRYLQDNRILFGLGKLERFGELGGGILTGKFAKIAQEYFYSNFGIKKSVEYCWSGQVLITEDRLPEVFIDGDIIYAGGANLSTGHFIGKEISKIILNNQNSEELGFINTLNSNRRKNIEHIIFHNFIPEKIREKIANLFIEFIAH